MNDIKALFLWLVILTNFSIFSQPEKRKNQQADLIIFSYDRPMQLYAYLESIDRLVTNLHRIFVLYRTSDDTFDVGYEMVKKQFAHVTFAQQTRAASGDFKPLLLYLCFKQSQADYLMFGVDDIIVTRYVDVATCVNVLEQSNAYGFYLRLGTNIITHYGLSAGKTVVQPVFDYENDHVLSWVFTSGDFFNPWQYPHSVDMTIFKKTTIETALRQLPYYSPNTLETLWAHAVTLPSGTRGACFKHACMVNIPLNLVQEYQDKHMNFATTGALLERFIKGEKIDGTQLFMYTNCSPHEDIVPVFVPRT